MDPHPTLPHGARDVVPHEVNGVFLGWTYSQRHRFTRRTTYRFVHADGTAPDLSRPRLLDAVNCLRGPAGLPALVDE